MREEEFTSRLLSTIDAKFAEIMASKPSDPKEKFLNYVDAQTISASIRSVFVNKTGCVPNHIEATLNICEAVMSPTLEERKKKIKKAAGIVGGLGGLSLTISTIITALGIGSTAATVGLWGTIKALLVGTPATPAGPIVIPAVLITSGVAIAALAGYLAFSGTDPLKNTERYMKALKNGMKQSVHQTWDEFGNKIHD